MNQATGEMTCWDPATLTKRDRSPMFVQIEKPGWDPPFVWSYDSGREPHPFAESDASD
jgi:hypothetical protein